MASIMTASLRATATCAFFSPARSFKAEMVRRAAKADASSSGPSEIIVAPISENDRLDLRDAARAMEYGDRNAVEPTPPRDRDLE